jgi:LuxR family maltose regulon positive regulatory protein
MGRRRLTRKSIGLAKLTPPTLPAVLKRPRLFRLLDNGRKRPLTWIVAPAGTGKTTLVASYLRARRLPVCWYRLDETDADPSSFFHFLNHSVKPLVPRDRKPLPVLTPEYGLGLPAFVGRYFQELCARLPRRCVLVLDNYHEVPAQSILHQLLPHAFQELPTHVSVIVMSRQGPPPPMAPLQAQRAMALISPDPLSFSKAETREIVRLHLSIRKKSSWRALTEEIYDRVGGWAAGLMLMLEHVKQENIMLSEKIGETPEAVFQFMATQVMDHLDPDVQDFLLKTSLLSDISVPLASKLTNLSNAGEILSSLHRSRYFTERREGAESSNFRYHPLLREFLVTQLRHKYNLHAVQHLGQISAGLLAEAGRQEEAIILLRDAEDWPEMSRQVIALAPAMLGQGRVATVEGWISSIPPTAVREFTWLRFWKACCRLFINPSEAHIIFEQVYEEFVAQGEQAGALLTWTNLVRCILFQWKGLPRLDQWIDRFASLQPDGAPYPNAEIEAQVAEAMAGALVWRRPENPKTRYWLERAITLTDRLTGSGAGHAIFLTESYLAWLGDIGGARKGNMRLLERASKPDTLPSMRIVYYLGEAMLGWIEGRTEDCRTAVRDGLSLAEREGIHLWNGWLIFQSIHNDLLSGRLMAAREQLEKVKREGSLEGLYLSQHSYHVAWHSMLIGDWQTALSRVEQALEAAVQDGGPFPEVLCCLLAASITHNCGNHQKAEAHRTRAQTIGEAMDSDLLRYGTLLLASQFAFDSGDRLGGLESLRDAFTLGRKQGMTEYPGWHAQAIARLCATALDEGIEVAYVQDLIRKRWLPLAAELRPAAWPCPVKIYTLGKFQVLIDGQPLEKHRKAPHRLLDLLKALVVCGGQEVPVSRFMDMLWPDADGDQAQENLKKSIARLRKLLSVDGAILWQEGKVWLNQDPCWVDALVFDKLAKQQVARATELYKGPFLGHDEISAWAESQRDQLRTTFVCLVNRYCDQTKNAGKVEETIHSLERAIEIDPLVEPLYQQLIPLLMAQGRQADARRYYEACVQAYQRWGNGDLSSETVRLGQTLTH